MENTEFPKRKQIRLKEYDYSTDGAYFVTMCTKDKKHIFWNENVKLVGANCVRLQEEKLSLVGRIIDNEIKGIDGIYDNIIKIDKYVVMPNHIHMIIIINKNNGRTQFAPTVSRIVKQFKGAVTKKIGKSIWQRSFYEHIIRNEIEYAEIWNYIDSNPYKWLDDEYYSD